MVARPRGANVLLPPGMTCAEHTSCQAQVAPLHAACSRRQRAIVPTAQARRDSGTHACLVARRVPLRLLPHAVPGLRFLCQQLASKTQLRNSAPSGSATQPVPDPPFALRRGACRSRTRSTRPARAMLGSRHNLPRSPTAVVLGPACSSAATGSSLTLRGLTVAA